MVEMPPTPAAAAALARLYDVDLAEDPGDLDLYLALAARSGGPILELASGTGRIVLALAEAGYHVTGVDLDGAMIERAERLLSAAGPATRGLVTLVKADVVGLALPAGRRFGLSILALNSILLMASRERQRAAVETMARHLAPGGLAVVDSWIPRGDELGRYDGRLSLEYVRTDPESGLVVTKTTAAVYEPATGHVELTAIYEEGEPGGAARRWVRRDRLLPVSGPELAGMAESAGLEVEVVAGGYDLSPLEAHDDRAIVVARLPGRAGRG